jgi:hypothetical protein
MFFSKERDGCYGQILYGTYVTAIDSVKEHLIATDKIFYLKKNQLQVSMMSSTISSYK